MPDRCNRAKMSGLGDADSVRFPPIPSPQHVLTMDHLRMAWKSAIDPVSATYIAAPITSGSLFADWYSRSGHQLPIGSPEYRAARHRAVVEPNIEAGIARVRELRCESPCVVIEPFTLNFPEWSQDDYRFFWASVIEEFADQIVLFDGWEFSNGASFEYWTAARCGRRIVDQEGCVVDRPAGTKRLRRGLEDLKNLGVRTTFLERVLHELLSLGSDGSPEQ